MDVVGEHTSRLTEYGWWRGCRDRCGRGLVVLIFIERGVKLAIHSMDYALLCMKWRELGGRRQWLLLVLWQKRVRV